jgi:hypothetical protein
LLKMPKLRFWRKQAKGNLQKLKLLCEMSIQPRLFCTGLEKQNNQNMCFHLGSVLCTCGF